MTFLSNARSQSMSSEVHRVQSVLTMYRKNLCNLVTINPMPIGEDEDRPINACLSSIRRTIADRFLFAILPQPD